MSAPTLTLAALRDLDPCRGAMERLTLPDGPLTARDAVEAGATLKDLVWVASAVARSDRDVERRLRLWMADCAARVLHVYERENPDDDRVRNAIVAARKYARGEITAAARTAAKDAARDDAWADVRAVAWAAAKAAAKDDAWAAAWAAAEAAPKGAARAAAGAAAWAAAKDDAWDAAQDDAKDAAWAAVWAAEEGWQLDRLVAWLSKNEPGDLPLPASMEAMQ